MWLNSIAKPAATPKRSERLRKSMGFLRWCKKNRRAQFISAYPDLLRSHLSAAENQFFTDANARFVQETSDSLLHSGLARLNAGKTKDAVAKFEQALELDAKGANVPKLKYNLAVAFRKLGERNKAQALANEVASQKSDASVRPRAYWLLAQCARELRDPRHGTRCAEKIDQRVSAFVGIARCAPVAA